MLQTQHSSCCIHTVASKPYHPRAVLLGCSVLALCQPAADEHLSLQLVRLTSAGSTELAVHFRWRDTELHADSHYQASLIPVHQQYIIRTFSRGPILACLSSVAFLHAYNNIKCPRQNALFKATLGLHSFCFVF
jgi:hypothetical protein